MPCGVSVLSARFPKTGPTLLGSTDALHLVARRRVGRNRTGHAVRGAGVRDRTRFTLARDLPLGPWGPQRDGHSTAGQGDRMAAGQFGAFGAPAVDAGLGWRATLEVPEHASLEEIKRAYRRAVKGVHPDLHPGDATAAAHFRALHEAYEALIASESRSSTGRTSMSRFSDAWEGQF
jgi:hypothetical protein